MGLALRPITLRAANRFIGQNHRHNLPVRGWIVGVSVVDGDEVVGVAVLGRPVGRGAQDGVTAEITRVATDGHRNACSMLYGAMTRAAFALGYDRVITYTLKDEGGGSLRASGFSVDAELDARPEWVRSEEGASRAQTDLFGEDRRPPGPKIRWVRYREARAAASA